VAVVVVAVVRNLAQGKMLYGLRLHSYRLVVQQAEPAAAESPEMIGIMTALAAAVVVVAVVPAEMVVEKIMVEKQARTVADHYKV
jgi:hypothetical protein